jgi:type IV pilus assembly protein PilN
MIKINLLPIRQARKRESVKQQLILGLVLLVGAGVGLYLWYSAMENKIDEKKRQIKTTEQQIEQYKKAIGEVEKYKGLEETLNRKLKIIDDLIRGKTGPVRVLDRLSQVIPKQVWLTDWKEKSGTVTLEGEAVSNKYVAQFITTLKDTGDSALKVATGVAPPAAAIEPRAEKQKQYFSNIRLVNVESGKDAKFVKFKIVLNVNYAI